MTIQIEAPPPARLREPAVIGSPDDPGLHPKLRDLWRFWNMLRGERTTPRCDEVHAAILKPWLGNVLLLDVVDGGRDFRYRVYGTVVAAHFGFDLTGRLVSQCVDLIGPKPLQEYRRVTEARSPEAVARISPAARDHLQMDKLALPLAAIDGGPVTRILAGLYASEAEETRAS
ncbi:PAS domain-containing protein [Desertibaculum subflavum]|uniref:PAS domain-containing protein n=1 Tax=Desertibaculum subflavum TaxID=2268458 RepID=UPI000E673216